MSDKKSEEKKEMPASQAPAEAAKGQEAAPKKNAKISKLSLAKLNEKLENARKDMNGGNARYIKHLQKRKDFLESKAQ